MKKIIFLICLIILLSGCSRPVELKSYTVVFNDGQEVSLMASNYGIYNDVFDFYSDSCGCDKVASFSKKDVKIIKVDF